MVWIYDDPQYSGLLESVKGLLRSSFSDEDEYEYAVRNVFEDIIFSEESSSGSVSDFSGPLYSQILDAIDEGISAAAVYQHTVGWADWYWDRIAEEEKARAFSLEVMNDLAYRGSYGSGIRGSFSE